MEKIIDLLKRNGLDDDSKIEHKVLDLWSLNQIERFIDAFDEIIADQEPNLDISPFSFMPNSNMSAQHLFCNIWDCRLKRIDQLSRFAAFYADSVLIPSYFPYLRHFFSTHLTWPDGYEDMDFRYNFCGDIKILNRIEPLLKNNIVKLIRPLNPGITLCSACASARSPEFRDINKRFKKNIGVLCRKYLPYTKATLTFRDELQEDDIYSIELTGPEDVFDDGRAFLTFRGRELPEVLLRKIRNIPRNELTKGIALSSEDLERSCVINHQFETIIMDLWTKYYLCRTSNIDVKYLTDREIDASLMDIMTGNKELRNYNQVVRDNIVCELPILNELPLDTILTIRQNEYDSFLVFRDSINSAMKECLANDTALTSSIARDIYEDIIQPKLNVLNRTFKRIRTSHLRQARQELLISTGLLTFGLFSLFHAPAAATVPLSLAAVELTRGLKSISDASATPEEIRNDDYFFLWKLISTRK